MVSVYDLHSLDTQTTVYNNGDDTLKINNYARLL